MKSMWVTIKMALTAVGGAIGLLLGGWDGFIYALVVFVTIDYITGVMSAVVQKKVSSAIGFRGIFKKIMIFVMVAIANVVDQHLIGVGETIRTATVFFYCANEGISILENAAEIGLPIPKKLRDILTQIRKKGEDDDDDKPNDL